MPRRFVVEDHLRDYQVYDCKRHIVVAQGMTRSLARRVARMLNEVAQSGSQPAPRMMHGRSRSGLTVSADVHPWEPDCDERGCVPEADYPGSSGGPR